MNDVDAAAEAAAQDSWEKEMEMMMEQRDNRSRSRSFIEMPSSSAQTEMPRTQSLGPMGYRTRGSSRGHDMQSYEGDFESEVCDSDVDIDIARQAAVNTKLYLAGSAPVDLDAIIAQDPAHANRNAGPILEAGPLSAKTLDILSQGLAMSTDDTERRSMTEEELEEKKMAEEEAIKLQREREIPSIEEPTEVALPSKKKGAIGKAFTGIKLKMFGGGKRPAASASTGTNATDNRSSITSAIGTSRHTGTHTARRASASHMPEYKDTDSDQVKRKPHKVKLLLLGDSGVGKTSLMRVFSGDEFSESMLATAGVDFKLRNLRLEDEYDVALQIWDTAGQERFHRITSTYYKGANGIILVYDVSDKRGFDNVGYWMKNIQQHSSNMPAMLLVGNKIDLPTRVVQTEEGQANADAYHCRYMETSAKTAENTSNALETIARDALIMTINPLMTQKELLEREQRLDGKLNKENCTIS